MTDIRNLEAWAMRPWHNPPYDPNMDYTGGATPDTGDLPDGYVSQHFRQAEFTCNHCGAVHPTNPTPPPQVLQWLEQIRENFGGLPINVNSGYRCPYWNTQVGGATSSFHLQGMAVDFYINGVPPAQVYEYCDQLIGGQGGVGKYASFTHIDNRGYRARWSG